MFTLRQTAEFARWWATLRDDRAKARIIKRLEQVEKGHLGDAKHFSGIIELRIDYGPGYRLYACRREAVMVIMLCGGDKSSQDRDVKRAVVMAKEV